MLDQACPEGGPDGLFCLPCVWLLQRRFSWAPLSHLQALHSEWGGPASCRLSGVVKAGARALPLMGWWSWGGFSSLSGDSHNFKHSPHSSDPQCHRPKAA